MLHRSFRAIALIALLAIATTASFGQLVSGLPDADNRSGRFVNVTRGLSSIGEDGAYFGIIAPGADPTLRFGIFDGDLGGKWDPIPSTAPDLVRFALYADPLAAKSAAPGNLVGEWFSTSMPDDDWFDIALPNAPAAFNAGANQYRYNLRVTWATTATVGEQNNFKIRTFGSVCATGRSSFGFIGYGPNDPSPSLYPRSKYSGAWNFYMDVNTVPAVLNTWNGDFDRADDGTDPHLAPFPPFAYAASTQAEGAHPGLPADDPLIATALTISPAIYHKLTSPDHAWTVTDNNPSGDREWESAAIAADPTVTAPVFANPVNVGDIDWKVPSLPIGYYRWDIIGADGRNTLFLHPDYDLYGACEVGDTVWEDVNGDGVQDAGEPGVAGVTVDLLDASLAVINTTTTNAAGKYEFDNLDPGAYAVRVHLPSGYLFTVLNPLADIEARSHADAGGITEAVVLKPGQSVYYLDAGLVRPASIGDRVWLDNNRDGLQDADEPGVANVPVDLLDAGGSAIASTTTNGTGGYLFAGLGVGTYSVRFGLPAAHHRTLALVGSDRAVDSDADVATGVSPSLSLISGSQITTVDAGLYTHSRIGDTVWEDLNGNGLQDAGEPGVAGVTVQIVKNGVPGATTTTNASGFYSFEDLTPGDYSVIVTLPSGALFTARYVGGDATVQSHVDAAGATETVAVAAGQAVMTLDAGIIHPAAIGDRVWLDLNGNGIQDTGEPGLGGVTVRLLDASGQTIGQTTTDPSGLYRFSGLNPGVFSVVVDVPVGYVVSPKYSGGVAVDSDIAAGTGATGAVTLASGDTNLTLDAGVFQTASLGDFAWLDANGNGIQDAGELPAAGVTVTLLSSAGAPLQTQVTSGTGAYLFTDLAPGSYKVRFGTVSGYGFTSALQGADRTVDSDVTSTAGETGLVALASGQTNRTIDAGYKATQTCGRYTTYTQGGWGARACGNNPGALLLARFGAVYPAGYVTVGGAYTLKFTSAAAIQAFLPQGGTARALTASAVNPTGSITVLAGQVLALRLNIDFSNAGIIRSGLGGLTIQSGPFAGLMVNQFSVIANSVLGGGVLPAGKSLSDVNNTATAINENYDNGTTNKGYLR
ncbi:MAG: carboxypeptidase regulatory-like domain-containing protein [Armatimonadetes bacterium]|nr:carboxypeptidase regulatory-like domain-containing protein [Armatimonadota bacterium]